MSDHDIDPTSPRMAPKPEVTKIDGRELKPSTLMMGYGYDPVLSEGSLKPPIFLTSTFAVPSAADGRAAREHDRPGASVRSASLEDGRCRCHGAPGASAMLAMSRLLATRLPTDCYLTAT